VFEIWFQSLGGGRKLSSKAVPKRHQQMLQQEFHSVTYLTFPPYFGS